MNILAITNGFNLLRTLVTSCRISFGVDVKVCKGTGVLVLFGKRVGDKNPAGFSVVITNPKAVLSDVHQLTAAFDMLADNVLAHPGTGARGEWRPIPT